MPQNFSRTDFQNIFITGVKEFNNNSIDRAHLTWETIWKKGTSQDRLLIKGFIQLTGAIRNKLLEKDLAFIYLKEKAIKNISENFEINALIDKKNLVRDLRLLTLSSLFSFKINLYD